MREAQARQVARALRLRVDVTVGSSPTVAPGAVMSQAPAVGASLAEGATVRVRISTGAEASAAPATAGRADPEDTSTRRERAASGSFPDTNGESVPATEEETADRADDVARIRRQYYEWLDAWQSRDLERYMRFYSPRVVQKRAGKPTYGYSAQLRRMAQTWAKQSFISIDSGPPSIHFEGDMALVEASHDYDSSTWWDRGVKRIAWRNEGGRWRIVEESFEKQAGGPRR
jgi:ketosteroid isomerase-like protein